MTHRAAGGGLSFPPGVRRQIEQLASHPPTNAGLELTHWSTRSLARAAVSGEVVRTIHPTTVSRILRAARLRPHVWCYCKRTTWTDDAIRRALSILWVYERGRIDWLWQKGIVVMAVDEKPNLQVLERACPTLPLSPGQPERQAFDYIRHGTARSTCW